MRDKLTPKRLLEKIAYTTRKAKGARTLDQFSRETRVPALQLGKMIEGKEIPTRDLLTGALRSPDITPIGRDWARACLKLLEMAAAEPTFDLDVERRL